MKEKKEAKINYLFTPVPFVLLRDYNLLNKNDRDLLVQIASFGPNGCFLTVNKLTENVLVCGEKAFYTSVYKLKHLKLIRFRRGNRTKSNHYSFEFDATKWRLTEKMSQQLIDDAKKMGIQNFSFEVDPFPNVYGFIVSYNSCYPSHPIELPQKNETASVIKKSDASGGNLPSASDMQYLEIQSWLNRLEQMEKNNSSFYVICNINHFSVAVAEYKAWRSGLLSDYPASETQKRYISKLIEKFELIKRNPKSEFEEKCFKLMGELSLNGMTGLEIEEALRKLKSDTAS